MTNPFRDQEKFMIACDQSVDGSDRNQYEMYLKLVTEEYKELQEAIITGNVQEQFDALLDIVVVSIGAMHSMGANPDGGWKEVMSTNFAKIDKETGKVRKREDGKVLKPTGWVPPDLKPFLTKEIK